MITEASFVEDIQTAIGLVKKPQAQAVAAALVDVVEKGVKLVETPTIANATEEVPPILAEFNKALGNLKILFPGL